MLGLELLMESLSVVFFSLLATLVIYVLIFWLLKRHNKYNVRNFWFILCSIPFIPYLFLQLSLYMACIKVENNIIEPARTYACSFAQKVDSYITVASDAVVGTINDVVSENSNKVKEIVTEEITNVIVNTKDSLKTTLADGVESHAIADSLGVNQDVLVKTVDILVDSLSDNTINVATSIGEDVINQTSNLVTESATNVVNQTAKLLPTNLIAELKDKFPSLALFLSDKGIIGDNSEEIVDSIFRIVKDAIKVFRVLRVLSLIKVTVVFIGLSLFFGWWKKKRKAKKMLMTIPQQEH